MQNCQDIFVPSLTTLRKIKISINLITKRAKNFLFDISKNIINRLLLLNKNITA
jgi:hypothetical protein